MSERPEPIFPLGFKVRLGFFKRYKIIQVFKGAQPFYTLSNGRVMTEPEIIKKHTWSYLCILADQKKKADKEEKEKQLLEYQLSQPQKFVENIKEDKETGLYLTYERKPVFQCIIIK